MGIKSNVFISLFFIPPININSSAVTYTLNGGRLGDSFISYLHAKWVSYRYNIPLLYKPFEHSDQFALHHLETVYTDRYARKFRTIKHFKPGQKLSIHPEKNILYCIDYFPESYYELHCMNNNFFYFTVDWQDPEFKILLKKHLAITDKKYFNTPIPAKTSPSELFVALHIRSPRNYHDTRNIWRFVPTKIPPLDFYRQALFTIAHHYSNYTIKVFLFTDDLYPYQLCELLQEALTEKDITHTAIMLVTNDVRNPLYDICAMTQCDILVRPESNLSFIATIVGNYQQVITATSPS